MWAHNSSWKGHHTYWSRLFCNINMSYWSLIQVTYSFILWASPSFCEPRFLIIFFTIDPKIMDKGIALRIVDLGFLDFSLCLGFPKRDHFKHLIQRICWHGIFQLTLSLNLSTRLDSRLESPQKNSNCEWKCMLVIWPNAYEHLLLNSIILTIWHLHACNIILKPQWKNTLIMW